MKNLAANFDPKAGSTIQIKMQANITYWTGRSTRKLPAFLTGLDLAKADKEYMARGHVKQDLLGTWTVGGLSCFQSWLSGKMTIILIVAMMTALQVWIITCLHVGFPGSSVVKNPPANAGDSSSIPGWGRSPWKGSGNPLQDSCLENLMVREAWWVCKELDTEWLNSNSNPDTPRFNLEETCKSV